MELLKQQELPLIKACMEAREKSYSPYSHFQVGAALLTKTGKIYKGCNIENAAYTPTNCAERTAFFHAVSEGERDFAAIAICGGTKGELTAYTAPCGVCRQVMMEFCNQDTFRVILVKSEKEYEIYMLKELMPFGFGPSDLQ
ncbi:MAG: cytidine deaminase [Clostridiales bacterium]|nr:cytidine deaminase [Clostridiales bacterium]